MGLISIEERENREFNKYVASCRIGCYNFNEMIIIVELEQQTKNRRIKKWMIIF